MGVGSLNVMFGEYEVKVSVLSHNKKNKPFMGS